MNQADHQATARAHRTIARAHSAAAAAHEDVAPRSAEQGHGPADAAAERASDDAHYASAAGDGRTSGL